MTRMTLLSLLAGFLGMLAVPASAQYPESTVTIVVGANPGASGDLLARMLAEKLTEKWGRTVQVLNRSGGSGLLSAAEVAKARPDGHTLFLSNDSPAINAVALKNPSVNHREAFVPISLLALIDFKLVVHPSVPARTVADLVAIARKNPGKLSYGSSGTNTPHHLMAEMFLAAAGIKALHVPFRGTAASVASVRGGHTDFTFSGFSGVDGMIEAGQLRALASTAAKRNSATPDLPTIGETLKGYSAMSWWAMWVRNEVNPKIRDQVAREVRAIVRLPDVDRRLRQAGLDPVGSSPEELGAFLNDQIARLQKLPPGIFDGQ